LFIHSIHIKYLLCVCCSGSQDKRALRHCVLEKLTEEWRRQISRQFQHSVTSAMCAEDSGAQRSRSSSSRAWGIAERAELNIEVEKWREGRQFSNLVEQQLVMGM
jgi:hypothetical protein